MTESRLVFVSLMAILQSFNGSLRPSHMTSSVNFTLVKQLMNKSRKSEKVQDKK